jgi:hypothetical protein
VLVIVSFALVLVATVLLVLGLLAEDGLTLIYVSIACSAGAAIVLFVAVRMAHPEEAPALAASGPVPSPDSAPFDAEAAAAVSATDDVDVDDASDDEALE